MLQLTGHKYKYVGSQDIVDTDEKYIKELERQVEDSIDVWNLTSWTIHHRLIPEICNLKAENRKLTVELEVIRKFLEKAKRMTNERFE
jgi:hypothetical protein|tara:strand:- start:1215 stop:1478 length:264 start_codon:yes stop_codon:yes gene_type:complete